VPVAATMLPNFHIPITDQSNERVIEVTLKKDIVWTYCFLAFLIRVRDPGYPS
jgi:hypothetical protein